MEDVIFKHVSLLVEVNNLICLLLTFPRDNDIDVINSVTINERFINRQELEKNVVEN